MVSGPRGIRIGGAAVTKRGKVRNLKGSDLRVAAHNDVGFFSYVIASPDAAIVSVSKRNSKVTTPSFTDTFSPRGGEGDQALAMHRPSGTELNVILGERL